MLQHFRQLMSEACFCSETTENVIKEDMRFERMLYSAFRNICL